MTGDRSRRSPSSYCYAYHPKQIHFRTGSPKLRMDFPVLKILFLSSEVTPFSRTGVWADVSALLPRALKRIGHEVRVVTPRYSQIRDRKYGLRDISRLRDLEITVGSDRYPYAVKSGFIPHSKVQIYFIDNPQLFGREPAEVAADSTDENLAPHLSFAFFVHCSLQLAQLLNWIPDIIYCCDWPTALAPHLLRHDPAYADDFLGSRTLLHQFKGLVEPPLQPSTYDRITQGAVGTTPLPASILEIGVAAADLVLTNSEAGIGLAEGSYSLLSCELFEQLCLLESKQWDPRTDPHIHTNYGSQNITLGKAANKAALQRHLGLPETPEMPLVAMWGRCQSERHIDFFEQLDRELPNLPLQLVAVAGDSDPDGAAFVRRWVGKYREKVASADGTGEVQLRLIEAGADMALLPTSHPADNFHTVNSLLYGTVPVVSNEGDGAFAVDEFDGISGSGNGFHFLPGESEGMVCALKKAVEVFRDKSAWEDLRRRGMDMDDCWERAARRLTDSFRLTLAGSLERA